DGHTLFTNSATIVDNFGSQATAQFGSDFDGVSDALEANVVYNNNPFTTEFPDPTTSTEPDVFALNAGARLSVRGNKFVNNNLLPFSYANGTSALLDKFASYEAAYMATNASLIPAIDLTNSIFPHLKGSFAVGVPPYTNVTIDVYQLDQKGWNNGKL